MRNLNIERPLTSIIYLAIALACTMLCFACQRPARKPNIILINVDDLGWTDLGCFGSTYYETPNIDRLSEQGMRLTNAYAAAAVCSPTRAAIMTGKYPARIGITDWIRAEFQGGGNENISGYIRDDKKRLLTPANPFHMELKEITVAELLKLKGYTTAHIGKWHLGTEKWYPEQQGFDFNIAGCDYGEPPDYFDPYIRYPNRWTADTLFGFPTMNPRERGEYLTDREGDEAVQFIRDCADKPFFLNLCHYAVHTPIQAKKELVAKYEEKTTTNQKSPTYAAMIESVDDATGKIVDVLKELGLTENSIVIFTSDNGGLLRDIATDNSPLRLGKGYPYEGGIRVPLIVKWPGVVKENTVSSIPVVSPDIFSTICDIVGIDVSEDAQIDGVSLQPVLKSQGGLNRDGIIWHFPHYRQADIVPYSIIRKRNWKLIKFYEGDRQFELYDLNADISESNDLSGELPDKVMELDAELSARLESMGARLPKRNPDYMDDHD